MWSDKLMSAILERRYSNAWPEKFKAGFEALFGGDGGRYPESAKRQVTLRAPAPSEDSEGIIPFAALIHPSNPSTGPYGGTSLAVFPGDDTPCMISLVVGTNGLAPDEEILGRPGHARKAAAVCAWLNSGQRKLVAWSKHDPTRLDQRIPSEVAEEFGKYSRAIERYGHVLYAIYAPGSDKNKTLEALTAFLDLMFDARGIRPLARFEKDAREIQTRWFHYLMPDVSNDAVAELLSERHYVILQGPPGTGKTHMARELIATEYQGARQGPFNSTQTRLTRTSWAGWHQKPRPKVLDFSSAPQKGFLMQAAEQARASSGKYLLHIDEINRADLSKVLGEAIYLLEPDDLEGRAIDLALQIRTANQAIAFHCPTTCTYSAP